MVSGQGDSLSDRIHLWPGGHLDGISLGLRTPLTPVVLALETLQKQWPQDEEARSTLEMIRRNIAVESHLIDDLLDLTRISKGKLKLNPVTLDAHAQVCNVVEMCRAEAEAKKVRLQVNLDATDHQ